MQRAVCGNAARTVPPRGGGGDPFVYSIELHDEIDGFYAGSWTCSEERLKAYVDYTIEGMKTGRFTYLAHPDLINYMGPDDVYCRHMRRIVETAVDMDLPLEINLYGFADGRWYPSDRFIKMAAEYHPRFVIGCDAHAPRFIRQPERVEGFTDFLKEYGIECGDNILDIKNMGSNAAIIY